MAEITFSGDTHVMPIILADYTHQGAPFHGPQLPLNSHNRNHQVVHSKTAQTQLSGTFFDADGGMQDYGPPPQPTTHHGASTGHMGLPQFGIEIADCSEMAHEHINRSDLLSIGIPPQLQSTNCTN